MKFPAEVSRQARVVLRFTKTVLQNFMQAG